MSRPGSGQDPFDVVVIGAGHNGLVAAVITYLLVSALNEGPRGTRLRQPAPEVRIFAADTAEVESIL